MHEIVRGFYFSIGFTVALAAIFILLLVIDEAFNIGIKKSIKS